jgi:fucose permease
LYPLGFAAFVAFGVVLVLVGANQDALSRALDLDLAASGLLGAALALGAGFGVTGAGPIVDRYARRPLFVASLFVAAAALLTLHPGVSYARAFAHLVVLGAGAGFYDTLLNAVVIQRAGADAARPLALLHAGATAGAVLGPLLVGALARLGDWSASFRATGVALVVLAAWAACVPLPPPPRAARGAQDGDDAATRDARGPSLWSIALLALAGVGFAYVGVETAVTVFAVPWAGGLLSLGAARGQSAISTFWLGLLVGRVAMLVARRELGVGFLLASGASGGAVLAVSTLLRVEWIEAATFAAGLALGAVYPVMIAIAGRRFPHASGTAAGLVAGAGALGGFTVPWVAGAVGDALGISAALLAIALFSAGITLAALVLAGRHPRAPS